MSLPLEGITVLEFSQYLAGPYAGLRLADLGARVIKVERPGSGDACRQLATKNLYADGDSLVFHTINRNKESYTANLKDPDDLERVKALIATADVMTHNFRPGVMEKIGLDYKKVCAINPQIIYGEVTGYGTTGPWSKKPGQDLLAQSVAGLTWLTGNADAPPVPFGMAVGDMICGTHFAQGILAALVRRKKTKAGARVEVSLLESLLDLQFEVLTTHLNDGEKLPARAPSNNAHAYLGAPYGIFETQDSHIAIAMGSLSKLGELIGLDSLTDDVDAYAERKPINAALSAHFKTQTTADWLAVLEPADYWCSDVLNYKQLMNHAGYQVIGMEQETKRPNGSSVRTLRCPIRINGERLYSEVGAPILGNSTEALNADLPNGGTPSSASAGSEDAAPPTKLPLDGVTVVDFSQFLSGPSASLRLADLGARVIKIERPDSGDICRQLYVSNVDINGESTLFHAINRNKESFCADLKSEADCKVLRQLVKQADVVMHNFRPDVMERLGFDYESVKALNPDVIYGEISGYGSEGPWAKKPGQDLLVQAVSGLTWLSGNADMGAVPMGLAVADIFSGAQLAQGILSLLAGGKGGLVQVSMLEAMLDFQFEPLTVYFKDGGLEPERTATNSAHAYLGAPYGLYETTDGYLALAMGSVTQIGELIGCDRLRNYPEPGSWFTQRDEIKAILADHLKTKSTGEWLAVLEPADIWCAQVHDWKQLRSSEAYTVLEMEQDVVMDNGTSYRTTRCPIRMDGQRLYAPKGSPAIGEHNPKILSELI